MLDSKRRRKAEKTMVLWTCLGGAWRCGYGVDLAYNDGAVKEVSRCVLEILKLRGR